MFTLGNIEPTYRSSLRVSHLLIAATLPVVEKHGLKLIMQPLVSDLHTMATNEVTVSPKGVNRTFQGALLLCHGDNLGSNTIGGFKQSFSFAFRFRRTCYITKDNYRFLSNPSELQLRSDDKHVQECALLNGALYEHYSKTYGINACSGLMNIPFFSMFGGGLAHDIMHDVLEGVAPLEMSLLLQHVILREKFLTLNDYNFRLTHFDYGYTETNWPIAVSYNHLNEGNSLKVSASQALLLMRILPLLIGDVVPTDDPSWKCFTLFLKIADIILCP